MVEKTIRIDAVDYDRKEELLKEFEGFERTSVVSVPGVCVIHTYDVPEDSDAETEKPKKRRK